MPSILVAGATGTQGGAVVDALTSGEHGTFTVYGLTRDTESEAARALSERGVVVVEGDTTDEDRMAALCTGMDGVFVVTTPYEAGVPSELEQGRVLINAAADAGAHVVFTSAAGSFLQIGVPFVDSKHVVEQNCYDREMRRTIVRPVYFMQNFEAMAEAIRDGELALPLAPDVELELVDAADVGRIAATAFADPVAFDGQTFELAGDALTLESIADAFGDALDRDVDAVSLDPADYDVRETLGRDVTKLFEWFNEGRYGVDPDAVAERFGVRPRTFPEYLADEETWRPAPAATR
jgi:uncharacterized protein YbjT (DUF2867 family)